MSQRKNNFLYGSLLLFTAIVWGYGFIAVKNSLDYMSTMYILATRFSIAAIGMCILFHKRLKLVRLPDILSGALLGCMLLCAFILQIEALAYTTVGKNAFLTAAYVVLVPVFDWFIKKIRPSTNSFIAAVPCLIGIGLLSLDGNFNMNFGDFLTLLCACMYALHMVMSDVFMKKGRDPITLNTLQITSAAVFSGILALVTEPVPSMLFDHAAIAGILYLGIGCTMLAFLFQMLGQSHTSPSTASLLLSTESVFGVLFSVLFLGEQLNQRMILGFGLIFFAIVISDIGIDFSRFRFPFTAKEENADSLE